LGTGRKITTRHEAQGSVAGSRLSLAGRTRRAALPHARARAGQPAMPALDEEKAPLIAPGADGDGGSVNPDSSGEPDATQRTTELQTFVNVRCCARSGAARPPSGGRPGRRGLRPSVARRSPSPSSAPGRSRCRTA
jgi:hypothetical protein